MKESWNNPKLAEAWSKAVGKSGDSFHILTLKPFLAAAFECLFKYYDKGGTFEAFDSLGLSYERHIATLQRSMRHPLRVSKIENALKQEMERKFFAGKWVLDLGAGEGFVGRWLADLGARYLGIDASEPLVREGNRKSRNRRGFHLIQGDLESFDSQSLGDHLKATNSGRPDVVTLFAVLDHIERPTVILERLARWLHKHDQRSVPLLATTLSPSFFLGSRQLIRENASPLYFHMGPSKKDVPVIPRTIFQYERIFIDSGFHVMFCGLTPLGLLCPAAVAHLRDQAGLLDKSVNQPRYPFDGPFVLWCLLPRHPGVQPRLGPRSDKRTLECDGESFGELKLLASLSAAQIDVLKNASEITVRRFSPHELIENVNDRSTGCYYVIRGYAERISESVVLQTFPPGEIFGEFEADTNPVCDRYLFRVRAGAYGCVALHIGLNAFQDLLKDPGGRFAGDLYQMLRGRFALYSWSWLKRARKGLGLAKRLGLRVKLSTRAIEHLCRALLFGLTVEYSTLDRRKEDDLPHSPIGSARYTGVVLATFDDLQEVLERQLSDLTIEDEGEARQKRKTSDDRKPATRKFTPVMRALVKGGLIDHFQWPGALDPERGSLPRELEGAWKELIDASYDAFLPKLAGMSEPLTLVVQATVDKLKSPETMRRKLCELGTTNTPSTLTKFGREVMGGAQTLLPSELRPQVRRWIANIAVAQAYSFSYKGHHVFRVREYHLLRDLACGRAEAIGRLIERYEARKEVHTRSVTHPSLLSYESMDLGRCVEYVESTVAHMDAHWKENMDITSTALKLRGGRSHVAEILESDGVGGQRGGGEVGDPFTRNLCR